MRAQKAQGDFPSARQTCRQYLRARLQVQSWVLHTPDSSLAFVLVQTLVKVVPPLKEHALADKLEPRREGQRLVLKHGLELGFGNVFGVANFVGAGLEVDVCLDEENIVDW